jgi:hypothetical protein
MFFLLRFGKVNFISSDARGKEYSFYMNQQICRWSQRVPSKQLISNITCKCNRCRGVCVCVEDIFIIVTDMQARPQYRTSLTIVCAGFTWKLRHRGSHVLIS